jgi:deazaflavin-dependent oxidoreductase (nitroreductase family)
MSDLDEARPASQRNQAYVEPPREQIPAISRAHVAALESSSSDAVWVAAGMRHLVLRTVGRRSGNEHKVALPYWQDAEGRRVVVASFAGAENHPSWFLNLSDREANPEVLVRAQRGSYWSVPEILEGEEYDRVWAELVADRPFYDDYRARTTRTLPLVRLPVARPA